MCNLSGLIRFFLCHIIYTIKEVLDISKPNPPRGKTAVKNENLINEEITASELRVIDENGEQAGIMLLEVAQQKADNSKLDLVLISPNANPPVAKIMDYGKYRYEQQKREKEAKKKQKIIQVKEIRLSIFIEKHDLNVKAQNAIKFLKDGDKVKVSLRFKGRERGRTDKGFEVMERFAELTEEYGVPEKKAAFEGRNIMMILSPLNEKEQKVPKKKEEKPEAAVDADSEEKTEPVEKADKTEKAEKVEKAEKADKPAKSETVAKKTKTVKSETADANDEKEAVAKPARATKAKKEENID